MTEGRKPIDPSSPDAGEDLDGLAALSGRVAHDLNNMLTVILGNVDSARAQVGDPDVRRKLDRAMDAARRAETLTARLSSAANGRPAGRKSGPFNLVQSLGDIVGRSVRPRTKADVRGGDETILMVEDNADVMEMGCGVLESLGYTVRQATTAAEALAVLAAQPEIDLLFSDIVMPGDMDGVMLAREVRRTRPGIAVLLTTGWAGRARDGEDDQDGFELIGKPYRRDDLARRVRSLLDSPTRGS